MKKLIILSLVLLVFIGCSAKTGNALQPEPNIAEVPAEIEISAEEPQSSEESIMAPSPYEIPLAYSEEAEKYYAYFMENNYVGMLGHETDGDGFSDAEMASYAICELIKLGYEQGDAPTDFSKEDIDAVTNKYFGTTIKNYENRMSTVIPETGRITSTGWGGSSTAYVLKELETDSNGIRTGTFYLFAFGMGEMPPSTKTDLLRGFFDDYGQPYLVTIVFKELVDENNKMYLRYYSKEDKGEAEPPYAVYQG